MTDCERIRAEAPGLMALEADDPERLAAKAHAARCPGCEKALREAERLQLLLRDLEHSSMPAGALVRAAEAIKEELEAERRRRSLWSAGAAAVLFALVLGLARHRQGRAVDWLMAGGLAVLALVLSAVSVRRPLLAITGGALAALAAAVVTGGPGPLEAGVGLHCLLVEMISAAAVVGAGWLALRGGTTSPARWAVAAGAAAGALAGGAALEVACAAHEALQHDLLFHLGGVLLAAFAASLLGRRRVAVA
ncbi:MAG TPA: hypothetical protein VFG59_11195 [Anaeromyxobacter sp.]|nr:hypothetical protein [Anaeromyxobacter sp.]